MGQNSSTTAFQNSSQPFFPRRRSHNKPPSPIAAALPEVEVDVEPPPKSPTYVVAENKVLPNGVSDITLARKLLRPVSQELSKVHPEYADIFQKPSTEALGNGSQSLDRRMNASVDNKENSSLSLNTPGRLAENKTITNGASHFRKLSISSDNITDLYKNAPTAYDLASDPINFHNHADYDITPPNGNVKTTSNLLRSQSMGLSASQPVNQPKHKRQISLASNSIQENVIPEDPREHLYNPARAVPFSNFQPSMTSLPVKSTFDIDHTMNLTYAQLAEYRKIKRASELEERTGKKLGELEAEISASSNIPKSPFDLQNRVVRSSTHSVSTRSSDTGVSKSKKKKAPAPPQPQLVSKTHPVASEPPPDYDMKDNPLVSSVQQSKLLQRSVSSASRSSKPPAPQPVLKSSSSVNLSRPGLNTNPAILPLKDLPESSVTLPRPAQARGQNSDVSSDGFAVKSTDLVQQSIDQAKEQLEAMKKLIDILKKPAVTETTTAKSDINNSSVSDSDDVVADLMNVVEKETALNNERNLGAVNFIEASQTGDTKQEINQENHHTTVDQPDIQQIQLHHTGIDQASTATKASQSMSTIFSTNKEPTKRIDPLLQKDIILAALARQAKSEVGEPTHEHSKRPPSEFLEEKVQIKISKEIAQNNNSGDDTSRSKDDRLQVHEEKTVLLSDAPAGTKRMALSEFGKRSSATISSHTAEFGSASSSVSVDKFSDKLPQLDNSLDQEDRSSSMSVDFSKRSSIQSENMSISSSNASGRVFSPDWTPEHDLDSDDDIMDHHHANTERRVSSEGFKASVIPPKVKDLHETPNNKKHRDNKKRDDTKEASISLSNDKSKFGSLRKFKKNVHQGMKNAFGSISKASGVILNKQKSQDLSNNPETNSPNRSAEFTNNVTASFRNPNWTLSRSIDESLHRRTLSDGFFNQRSVNVLEHSDVSDHSEDDLGDIDFAGGINDIPEVSRRPKSGGKKEMLRKSTGDVHEHTSGQIVPRGEHQSLNMNSQVMKYFEEHSQETHKEKKQFRKESVSRKQEKQYVTEPASRKQEKQFVREPASREHENNQLEAVLAKMIAEKEQQFESEILRRQEIEGNFRRLRDLEDKELVQRLQKAITREEIRQLQEQHILVHAGNEMNNNGLRMSSLSKLNPEATAPTLNNSPLNNLNTSITGIGFGNKSVILSPVNNLGASPGAVPINTAYINANQLSIPFQYLANGNASLLQTGYLDSPINFQNITGVQHSYNSPPVSTPAIGQSISPIGRTSVNYIPPLVSGGVVYDGFTNNTIPKLTQQELVYLGEYMRMIGVPPPANHHEWAVLLNSVGYNTSTLPLIGQMSGPKTFPVAANGPDLTRVFGNKNSLNDHTSNLTLQITDVTQSQQHLYPNKTQPSQRPYTNEATTISTQLQDYTNHRSLNPEHQNTSPNNTTESDVIKVHETQSKLQHRPSSPCAEEPAKHNPTKTITSGDKYTIVEGIQVNTSANTTRYIQTVNSENFPQTSKVPPGTPARTNLLPAKVYAPLGFRPVAFNPSPR